MLNYLTIFAVERRWLIICITLLIALYGLYNAKHLPIDAVPDITNIQVQINTQADGYSPLETEQRITYIIENAMAGLPSLDYTRSLSRYGLSQVTVIFNDGTDIYWARQQINQRIQNIKNELPTGVNPEMGPVASGLGEIFTYAIKAADNAQKPDGSNYSSEELRTIQDWIIKPQLVKVKGVTEVNSIGGYQREYEVTPIIEKLLAYKITISDIIHALNNNNQNAEAGFIERNGEQWLLRSSGQLKTVSDIENIYIAKRDSSLIRIKDVADVGFGKELRSGSATYNGEETVLGTVFMLLGENSRTVSQDVSRTLIQINKSLPKGVITMPLYDRTTLVDKTLNTVKNNLLEGAILVVIVLFLLLGNIKAAIIAALVIPLSMLFAIIGMSHNKVSGNLMSLGAIDFGLIVDGAVIVVDNCLKRLSLYQKAVGRNLTLQERLSETIKSTQEVLNPAVFGVLIIMLVYLPLFTLTGVEKKMFHPMAFTVIAALLGALIFSITFVPAMIAITFTGSVVEKENKVFNKIQKNYQNSLRKSLRYRTVMITISCILIIASVFQATKMGSEFLPKLNEHDIAMHAMRIPGTGIEQSTSMQKQLEKTITTFPEVKHVFSKIGTPEIATDPMPPNVADTFLILKEIDQWPNPNKSREKLINEIRIKVEEIPGNKYEFTQPIEMRFNELIAGVRSDIAIRIYGDNLNVLAEQAEKIKNILEDIPGASDVSAEQSQGLPMISIEPQREHLALIGLNISDIQQSLQYAVSGTQVGIIYEGDKRFRLMLRLDDTARTDIKALAKIPIFAPLSNSALANSELNFVPLGEVAELSIINVPNQINRKFAKRNVVVTANVTGRDLSSFMKDTQFSLDSLELPVGYWIEYGGTFEQLQSATERLSVVIPLTLLLILGLLCTVFNSLKDALIIFTGVPLALTGGIFALWLRDIPLSISAAVGFIALSGIAVLNGVVLLTFIKALKQKHIPVLEAVISGATSRLRPVLMTALVASLGFIPMAINTGLGAEVQRPLATVVIGGIISSTILTLYVLPALYSLVYRNKLMQ
jgi:cobalt-zinc-cadmium resistance protein CzcA